MPVGPAAPCCCVHVFSRVALPLTGVNALFTATAENNVRPSVLRSVSPSVLRSVDRSGLFRSLDMSKYDYVDASAYVR